MDISAYLRPTYFFDYKNVSIQAYVVKITEGAASDIAKAVALYRAIRDGWQYHPYNISFDKAMYRASTILQRPEGHCVDKSILMTACCRAVGIAARFGIAKVRNHIAAEKMMATFGSDELVPHGYCEVYLDGDWLKTTPVFNASLCHKLGVAVLDFDGKSDAIFQAYDQKGGAFMEYIEDYGTYSDVPLSKMFDLMLEHYPHIFVQARQKGGVTQADFEQR